MPARAVLRWIVDGAIGLLVLSALVITGLRFHHAPADPLAPRLVRDWKQYGTAGNRVGPQRAPVTIVEFADYQCPFCRRAVAGLSAIRQQHPNNVAVIYRHYPGHEFSFLAAVASECAARQGAFEAMHDVLYAHADAIGKLPWVRFARMAGINDTSTFVRCLTDDSAARIVVRDTLAATALTVRGTPTFLVNNVLMLGYNSESQKMLDSLVRTMAAER